jgi:hypothetical protein
MPLVPHLRHALPAKTREIVPMNARAWPFPPSRCQTARRERIASSGQIVATLAISSSPFVSLYLRLAICLSFFPSGSLPFRPPPMRGVRSAGGAWMPATHPDRRAITGAQTPLSIRSRANPPCVHCAPRADPTCDRFAHIGQARSALRRLAFPATETLALRRSTWDFWPGPVLAVVRHALRDRAATSYAARVIVTRRSGSREPPRRGC